MVTMELPIMDHIVSSPDARETWGLEAAIRSMISDLLDLDYHQWQEKLSATGLTDLQIKNLNEFVDQWASRIETASLSTQLQGIEDVANNPQTSQLLGEWFNRISTDDLQQMVVDERLPNPVYILSYAMCQTRDIASRVAAFELARREVDHGPSIDWSMTPDQVACGTEMAEIGLAEDAEIWPHY